MEIERRKLFVQTFKRWSIMFKRAENNVEDDKWLIAEYYDSLKHLSPAGLDALTKRLRESCTFFPTIRECLEAITPKGPYDWGHPFLNRPPALFVQWDERTAITSQRRMEITDER